MSDQGVGRSLQIVFGVGSLFHGMGSSPIAGVSLSPDKARVTFSFADGSVANFRVEGDCCSRSWIEHLDVPPYVIGEALTGVEDARISREDEVGGYDECLQVYNTRFRTAKGDIVLEYRNSSNGYYGGYLVREEGG